MGKKLGVVCIKVMVNGKGGGIEGQESVITFDAEGAR